MTFARVRRRDEAGAASTAARALALACAVLGLAGVPPGRAAESPAPHEPGAAAASAPSAPDEPSAPPAETDADLVVAILERPLFSPQRRPPAAPVETVPPDAAAAPPPEWRWRLAGIMIGPNGRQALFARDGENRAVAEGQEIDGWVGSPGTELEFAL